MKDTEACKFDNKSEQSRAINDYISLQLCPSSSDFV